MQNPQDSAIIKAVAIATYIARLDEPNVRRRTKQVSVVFERPMKCDYCVDCEVQLLPSLGGGRLWNDVAYSSNNVVLSVGGVLGDYSLNGIVDAADYIVWRTSLGQTGPGLFADGDGNAHIDTGDFEVWRSHFGQAVLGAGSGSGASANATIPEPATLVMLIMAAAASIPLRRRRVT